ncbi:MAG: ATP-binding cassette domain-containing protein, partial [Nitriliruptoraceae bacterium]
MTGAVSGREHGPLSVNVKARIGAQQQDMFTLTARFELPPGLTVVFGPSGAGKSRLLRLIAGLDEPEQGRIALAGKTFFDSGAATSLPVHERRIGMVFQQSYLLPHRTIHANVALAATRLTKEHRRSATDHWLERTGATPFAARRPHQLSGGQQQRVSLARALVGDPQLLLLDEPFNALDLKRRHRLRTLVRELVTDTGIPTLFVTHDLDEVTMMADQVLLAHHGNITELTSVAAALADITTDSDVTPP